MKTLEAETVDTTALAAIHAVVVDDEPFACAHLAHLLREAGVGTVHELSDGAECVSLCARDRIDWVFLDIRMPGLDGLAVADALHVEMRHSQPPAIVYVTGYEDYAIQAFEKDASDYMLKPVERTRLSVTLNRLLSRISSHADDGVSPAPLPPLQRLPIRTDFTIHLVEIGDILAAVARDKRVEVITPRATYPTYFTLSGLEQRLPADQFLRVHESWIVNLTHILEVHSLGSQSYQLRLRHGGSLIPVSRRRLPLLQQRLGL